MSYSENFGKLLKIYSRDITSNGADLLRHALGTYYKPKGDVQYATYEFPESETATTTGAFVPDRPLKVPLDSETDLRGIEVLRAEPLASDEVIAKIEVNPARIREINADTYIPNFIIPVRLYANEDTARGDKFWETYFKGGMFGGVRYPTLIDQTTIFYDTEINFYHQYSNRDMADFKDIFVSSNPMTWKIQTYYNDYDQYVQKYQDWADSKHELLLPNFNFSVTSFISFDTLGSDPASMQKKEMRKYYYPNGAVAGTLYEKNRWCGDAWIDYLLSNDIMELEEKMMHCQQNIIFDHGYYKHFDFVHAGADEPTTSDTSGYAPIYDVFDYYSGEGGRDHSSNMLNVTIEWDRHRSAVDTSEDMPEGITVMPPEPTTTYEFSQPHVTSLSTGLPDSSAATQVFKIRNIIEANNFSSKFMEILKDLDEGNLPALSYKKERYDVNQFTGLKDDSIDKLTASVQYMDLNVFDWMHYLSYMYNEYDVSLNNNFTFIGPVRISHSTTYEDSTAYRFYDNKNLLKVLDETIDLTREYFDSLITAKDEVMSATTVSAIADAPEISRKIFDTILSPVEKRHEVLAYKIEKIGGGPTGDSGTQNIIQKFWHWNSSLAASRNFLIDTQVKYGETYTYKGYAYVLVMAHKYKYSDFRLTKQIAIHDLDGDGNLDRYCVEFYDPFTMERAEQTFGVRDEVSPGSTTIMEAGPVLGGAPMGYVAEQSALTGMNTFATNGQEISEFPQLADFNLNIEPCIKIIEVPIFEKTVVPQDNPPNNISVMPFHFIDNSHRVGFDMFADGFRSSRNDSGGQLYPIPITDDDIIKKTNYLQDKDLIETDYVPTFSQSPARYIEMFRTTTKPTSFESFDGQLVSRIDLRIENEEFNRKDFIAADKISPGVKYYYVFRFVNENGMPGPLSPILETELHDDGGYVYCLFDILDSSEFKIDPFVKVNAPFKKIFQLEPNLQHLMLDATGVNFADYASNQINNVKVGLLEHKIWDKKFKIRLTSKKTGKKLDINVTYNIRERDLSPELIIESEEGAVTPPPEFPTTDGPPEEEGLVLEDQPTPPPQPVDPDQPTAGDPDQPTFDPDEPAGGSDPDQPTTGAPTTPPRGGGGPRSTPPPMTPPAPTAASPSDPDQPTGNGGGGGGDYQ